MSKSSAVLSVLVLSVVSLQADNDAPELAGYPLDRYQAIREKSPFSKETPVEENVAGPLFGQDLVLAGHYKLGETVYAVILNKKTQQRLTASSTETQGDKLRVISLSLEADPTKSTAVIQLGAEKATLKFDIANAPKETQKDGAAPTPQPTPSPAGANKPVSENSPQNSLPRLRYNLVKAQGAQQ
jgi:hypothetical protein